MDRWLGKVAVVTGASSGIGAATTKELVKAGLIVVGLARRNELIELLREDLPKELADNLHALYCDITKEDDIKGAFAWVESHLGGVDVLVNSAGVMSDQDSIAAGNSEMVTKVINTNLTGLIFCTREAVQSMLARSVNGHIFHLGSEKGHVIPLSYGGQSFSVYLATKYAIPALTEIQRQEVLALGSGIKVTCINPSGVRTDLVEDIRKLKMGSPLLEAEDVANAILYSLRTPPKVQVLDIIMKPVKEIF